jgi:methyl-accepting chemotaxis protein
MFTNNEIARSTKKAIKITTDAVTRTHEASSQAGTLGQAAQGIDKVVEAITEIFE